MTRNEDIRTEIVRQLGGAPVEIALAIAVRDRIDEMGLLDWSECTRREFADAVRYAFAEVVLDHA